MEILTVWTTPHRRMRLLWMQDNIVIANIVVESEIINAGNALSQMLDSGRWMLNDGRLHTSFSPSRKFLQLIICCLITLHCTQPSNTDILHHFKLFLEYFSC